MKDAIFLIASAALLASVVEQVDKILELLARQAERSQEDSYVDLMGDLCQLPHPQGDEACTSTSI